MPEQKDIITHQSDRYLLHRYEIHVNTPKERSGYTFKKYLGDVPIYASAKQRAQQEFYSVIKDLLESGINKERPVVVDYKMDFIEISREEAIRIARKLENKI